MKKITQKELNEIIKQHKHWFGGDGRAGTKADLSDHDLSDMNLAGADLRGANLKGADLTDAYIEGARFEQAELEGVKGMEGKQ